MCNRSPESGCSSQAPPTPSSARSRTLPAASRCFAPPGSRLSPSRGRRRNSSGTAPPHPLGCMTTTLPSFVAALSPSHLGRSEPSHAPLPVPATRKKLSPLTCWLSAHGNPPYAEAELTVAVCESRSGPHLLHLQSNSSEPVQFVFKEQQRITFTH
ncbi:hypothetical protein CFC21_099066 [Triticum aestivum]|uniref:Uncharacterized protein n=3 Tax=Triticum TaxID=4564 RepID=A0A9R0ZK04_TRITD|nr:hypothetical protein CFC21_099066 [Triticum aestivum]VAI78549.1 unnamed protein product [Triticum turgidum subsp. durum]